MPLPASWHRVAARVDVAETVGALADKLIIVQLKLYHMTEQAERVDASADFRGQCLDRVEVLRDQRAGLSKELDELLSAIASGAVVPRVFRQFKMYNDPRYRFDGERR